jgi:HAD superfamily hydrolase (TIGR01509 family)
MNENLLLNEAKGLASNLVGDEEISLEIVPRTESAARIVMEWRNQPATLAASFHQAPKIWESFSKEFDTEYFRDSSLPCLFALQGKKRIGFVRFRSAQQFPGIRACDLSIMLDASQQGKGYGARIVIKALTFAKNAGIQRVLAEVKTGNDSSKKMFEKAGFRSLGKVEHKIIETGETVLIEQFVYDVAKPRAILFDLDGTLADTMPGLFASFTAFTGRYGINYSKQDFHKFIGPSLRQIVSMIKVAHSLSNSEEELYDEYMELLKEQYETVQEISGASKLLDNICSCGIKMSIVSSAPRKLIETFLSDRNWNKYFEVISSGDDVERAKPHPQIYSNALTQLNISSSEAIAVEDAVNGVKAAVAAGISTIGLDNYENERQSLLEAGATTVVSKLQEIETLLVLNVPCQTK